MKNLLVAVGVKAPASPGFPIGGRKNRRNRIGKPGRHRQNAGTSLEPNSTAPKVARPLTRAPRRKSFQNFRTKSDVGYGKNEFGLDNPQGFDLTVNISQGPQRPDVGGVRLRANSKVRSVFRRKPALWKKGDTGPRATKARPKKKSRKIQRCSLTIT
jgi:hypothetical protein